MSLPGGKPGNSEWIVDWSLVPEGDKAFFKSANRLLATPMQQVTSDRRSGVSRLEGEAVYYVKTFRARGSRLRHALGISRFQRELRNLSFFDTRKIKQNEITKATQTKLCNETKKGST